MVLKERVRLGVSLPHRSPEALPPSLVRAAAQRAEALGFGDLWVTENTLDHVFSFDPAVVLTWAAAATTRVRLGVSVVVLPLRHPAHVAHQWASLDYLSGGRTILGVGLGRDDQYLQFGISTRDRVRRFVEGVALIRALWSGHEIDYRGTIFRFAGGPMLPLPRPPPAIWLGVGHPDALRRAARIADGWMGAGGSTTAAFAEAVPLLRAALEKAGRDPDAYTISKRVFTAIDERPRAARAEIDRWFTDVYHNPAGTDAAGIHGTPEQVAERLQELVAMGANHLVLNPVSHHLDQIEALAAVVGLT